jgi:3-oxoacyl-[acyl-carrier-protein] synthase-3
VSLIDEKMGKAIKITGTGSYVPEMKLENASFNTMQFFDQDGQGFPYSNEILIEKFKEITGIEARRYARKDQLSSDLGTIAAERAIQNAGIDPETIDQIIVAHNFADVHYGSHQADILPSIASRIKFNLKIKNPNSVAYDILYGCPGWIQGVIQSEAYILAGMAKTCLVIGTETLSRVVDPHDRDSMIYSDGAGACILQAVETDDKSGILSTSQQTFTSEEAYFLHYGPTFNRSTDQNIRYIKMHGRKIYEFALNNVPAAMKVCFDQSGEDIRDVKKVLIHQANEKMDFAIIKRFYKMYGIRELPEGIMPMSINQLGNSSVATVPTLLDLILKKQLDDHSIEKGDLIILASVGSGMAINSITYRF